MKAKRELFNARIDAIAEVNSILVELYNKKLWHVSESDGFRLLRLFVWSEKYCVDVEYILSTLVPYFSKAVSRRTGRKSKGLGVSIATLTGDVAEEILAEKIAKEFPSRENYYAHVEDRKNEIETILSDDDTPVRPKSVLLYRTVKQHVEAYSNKIEESRRRIAKQEAMIAKQPFRDNPYM